MRHAKFVVLIAVLFVAVPGIARSGQLLTPRLDSTTSPCALTSAGLVLKTLQRGNYLIVVHDRSVRGYFRLSGANLSRKTTAPFVGVVRWRLRLAPGTYRYSCSTKTRRSFRVR